MVSNKENLIGQVIYLGWRNTPHTVVSAMGPLRDGRTVIELEGARGEILTAVFDPKTGLTKEF